MDYQENKGANRRLHILIAHSQRLVREGLRAILKDDAKVAAISEVATYEDLKNQCTSPALDLVIVHQELIEDIKILPKGHFVLLLTHRDKDMLLAARDHGVRGYITIAGIHALSVEDDLQVLVMSRDNEENSTAVVRGLNLRVSVVSVDHTFYNEFRVRVMPFAFLIDPSGIVRWTGLANSE